MNFAQRFLAFTVSLFLPFFTLPQVLSAGPPTSLQEDYANLPDSDLDALVAPIALYPDALVAQVLGAATYPDQVVEAEAKKEFLARQIGDNELTVVDVLNAMADAQSQYFLKPQLGSKVKQYARRFISSEGMHDGLYWKPAAGEPESPLGPLAARASAEGYKTGSGEAPAPFHGYFFRILTEQGHSTQRKNYIASGNMTGGFAFIAYPAEYRVTGVMSFIVNQDGTVYERDLGPDTTADAKSTTTFDPDDSWSPVE